MINLELFQWKRIAVYHENIRHEVTNTLSKNKEFYSQLIDGDFVNYLETLNILKIAELDCCQIIILSIYGPSTHAYAHILRLSLDLPTRKGNTTIIEAPFLGSGCSRVV